MKLKLIVIVGLLFSAELLYCQSDLKEVWNLMLSNKRKEAKILFDKSLSRKKNEDIDIYTTGLILQVENGQLRSNKNEVNEFLKFEKSPTYIFPLHYLPLFNVFGDNLYSSSKLETIDALYEDLRLRSSEIIKFTKLLADKYRRNMKSVSLNEINSINNWQLCGVFENLNKTGINTFYEPEEYPKADKIFDAKSNGKVKWYNISNRENGKGYYYMDNENAFGSGIVYAQVFVKSPESQTVLIKFGHQNNIKIFLNDVEIYLDDEAQPNFPESNILKVTLNKGNNRLLVKNEIQYGSDAYLYFSLTDINGNKLNNLVYNNSYQVYEKSTKESLDVQTLEPAYYSYFRNTKREDSKYLLHQFLLAKSYQQNGKVKEFYNHIKILDTLYPNSSMVSLLKKSYFTTTDQSELAEELDKKIEMEDSFYYTNFLDDFFKAQSRIADDKEKIEEKMKKSKDLDPLFQALYKMILSIKDNNKSLITKNADTFLMLADSMHNVMVPFASLYKSIDNNEEKYLNVINDLYSKYDNKQAYNIIISELDDAKNYDSILKLKYKEIKKNPSDNSQIESLINYLLNKNANKEAMSLTDSLLYNFPFSIKAMELKGDIYKLLQKKDSAAYWYRRALDYDPTDYSMHKAFYEFIEHKDELEEIRTKDIYQYISKNRGKKHVSENGVVILLDEYLVNVYDEFVCKSKSYLIYEITSKEGIEKMKELQRGGDADYTKSEIIKVNGKVIPIENDGYSFVSTNLEVGDVILLDYEDYTSNSGRFYQDINKWNYFVSEYPCIVSRFGILYPDKVKFKFNEINGTTKMTLTKIKGKNYQTWEGFNLKEIAEAEDYCPSYYDRVHCIALSTIKNWGEIANWYLALLKDVTKLENEALEAYTSIFPDGAEKYDERTRAQKIYYYIANNFNYSSVNFRQSGYVPQKPAKTVRTKLGDCKDLSTLFVVMAEKAGLDAKLVLTLTSPNGTDYIKLPEIVFDHMIVKLKLDGKDNFLEMTDKDAGFLGYNSGLEKAIGLVVNLKKEENENSELIQIRQNFENEIINVDQTYKIGESKNILGITISTQGNNGFYKSMFFNENSDELIKKNLEEVFSSAFNKSLTFIGYEKLLRDTINNRLAVRMNFEVKDKPKTLGNLKMLVLPIIYKAYSVDVIKNDVRKFDIDYSKYENYSQYNTNMKIEIDSTKKFAELPSDFTLNYKKHSFSIKYLLESPSVLKVKIETKTDLSDITTEEYPEFKKYVEAILEKQRDLLGYK